MHTLTDETTSPTPSTRRGLALPSFDLYGDIHRALRLAMTDLLAGMGRTDPADAGAVLTRLDELEGMLDAMASHIAHEATFLHVALERRLAGAAIRLDIEHAEHARAMEELKELGARVRSADSSRRPAPYRALYLRYAAFVGESLVHMSDEETKTQALFDDLFTAAELHALHDALLASIPPPEMMRTLQIMIPAIDVASRTRLLAGAKASMPPEAFVAFLPVACAALSIDEVAFLTRRLGEAA